MRLRCQRHVFCCVLHAGMPSSERLSEFVAGTEVPTCGGGLTLRLPCTRVQCKGSRAHKRKSERGRTRSTSAVSSRPCHIICSRGAAGRARPCDPSSLQGEILLRALAQAQAKHMTAAKCVTGYRSTLLTKPRRAERGAWAMPDRTPLLITRSDVVCEDNTHQPATVQKRGTWESSVLVKERRY